MRVAGEDLLHRDRHLSGRSRFRFAQIVRRVVVVVIVDLHLDLVDAHDGNVIGIGVVAEDVEIVIPVVAEVAQVDDILHVGAQGRRFAARFHLVGHGQLPGDDDIGAIFRGIGKVAIGDGGLFAVLRRGDVVFVPHVAVLVRPGNRLYPGRLAVLHHIEGETVADDPVRGPYIILRIPAPVRRQRLRLEIAFGQVEIVVGRSTGGIVQIGLRVRGIAVGIGKIVPPLQDPGALRQVDHLPLVRCEIRNLAAGRYSHIEFDLGVQALEDEVRVVLVGSADIISADLAGHGEIAASRHDQLVQRRRFTVQVTIALDCAQLLRRDVHHFRVDVADGHDGAVVPGDGLDMNAALRLILARSGVLLVIVHGPVVRALGRAQRGGIEILAVDFPLVLRAVEDEYVHIVDRALLLRAQGGFGRDQSLLRRVETEHQLDGRALRHPLAPVLLDAGDREAQATDQQEKYAE